MWWYECQNSCDRKNLLVLLLTGCSSRSFSRSLMCTLPWPKAWFCLRGPCSHDFNTIVLVYGGLTLALFIHSSIQHFFRGSASPQTASPFGVWTLFAGLMLGPRILGPRILSHLPDGSAAPRGRLNSWDSWLLF